MKRIISILAAVGLASAGVIKVPVTPLVGHVATQYHAQDELGQYSYGYAGGPSAKEEIKTADGITRGGYSYVDGNGLVQSAAYVSDPVNGFRVAATNLPAGPGVPATPGIIAPAPVVPVAPTVPLLPSNLAAAVRVSSVPVVSPVASAPVNSLLSTVILKAASPITVLHEAPAPVNEKVAEEQPVATESSPSAENPPVGEEQNSSDSQAALELQPVQATIDQLVTPVQDTPEVQAAKAAHLAAFEEVKLRDAALEAEDSKNNINTSDLENENSQDSGESTESLTETTEGPASEAPSVEEPVTPTLPALQEPAAPNPNVAVPASVMATHIVPAASPAIAPVVPSVLTSEVVAAPAAFDPLVARAASAPGVIASPAAVASVPSAVILGGPVAASPSGPVALEHVGQITSQYHAQDELGQYTFGYSGGPSAKHEVKTVDGLTSGGYSYIDSHGLVQSAAYVSDPVNGFRVAATNIPKQREPEYIPESPEVEEAKKKLFQAQAEHIAKL